jgi:diphosphomevalonate decarboxylase
MDLAYSKKLVLTDDIPSGKVSWKSPSNIALIKYWGKFGDQLPKNPSLSLTLDQAFTETTLQYAPNEGGSKEIKTSFYLDEKRNESFEDRIRSFFKHIIPYFPFLPQLEFQIHSRNSFPHSAGIASSASGLSALALCLCTLEDILFQTLGDDKLFREKASFIARLGSGSACRSIFSVAALWGKTGLIEGASNEWAIGIKQDLNPVFHSYRDAILIVSNRPKEVSSRSGHALMETNVYAQVRYEQAKRHLHQLLEAMKAGDLDRFGQICEQEALELHALMLSSQPYFLLMQPQTLHILKLVQEFRKSTTIPLYFTLDAGPNVHLLYPQMHETEVYSFITNVLVNYCFENQWIPDRVGEGPLQID